MNGWGVKKEKKFQRLTVFSFCLSLLSLMFLPHSFCDMGRGGAWSHPVGFLGFLASGTCWEW